MLKDEISIENFVDNMIADEREASTEEEILEYMQKVAHPAFEM